MRLLDTMTVESSHDIHTIEIYNGDLTDMPHHHAVDVLVLSAFPNSYATINPRTLISALHRKGVSVRELAKNKYADLRDSFACWLSHEVSSPQPGIEFKRILCFEPPRDKQAAELVGSVFQSLMPFVHSEPNITSIAMSLLATGSQRAPVPEVLEALMNAAVNWLALGLPVKTIKIVEYDPLKAAEMKGAFAILKKTLAKPSVSTTQDTRYSYDYFISYSHDDTDEASVLYDEMRRQHPRARIFFDRTELDTGAAWQQKIYEALDTCRKVVALYSPTYLTSKVCKEEFNIAMLRHRDSDDGVLIPVYLHSTELPSYMQLIQYLDCRERDRDKLRAVCSNILTA